MNSRLFLSLPWLAACLAISGFPWSASADEDSLEATQRINHLIEKGYAEHGVTPNPPASDEVFVRRLYLDVIGRIPTRRETVDFLANPAPDKRARLVDELLASDGYVSHHFNYWADILRAKTQISGNGQSTPAGMAYAQWIKQSLRDNKPYDEFVREMLSASGSSWDNPAIGYYLRDYGMPLDNLAITTQVFLGTQIVCAQCHDHPFDSWTQMDYYHLSAFTYGMVSSNNSPNQRAAYEFSQSKARKKIGADESRDVRKAFSEILRPVRFNNVFETKRSLRLPKDYQYSDAKPGSRVEAQVPFAPGAAVSDDEPPIQAFADWVTSPENPRFTKVVANRLWKKAFGIGVIEPVDDLREDTVASNPELMSFLEQRMVELDFDMKAFLCMIYNTDAYQREASVEESVPGLAYRFPGPVLRRMSAEQIWDSVVAMAVSQADLPDRETELTAKQRLTEVELVASAVYDQKPGKFLRNAYEIAQVQRELAAELQKVQDSLAAARESRDPKAIRQASQDAQKIRRQLALQIEEKVYREELEEKIILVTTKAASADSDAFIAELAAAVMEESDEVSAGMDGLVGEREGIVRQLVATLMADEKAAYERWKERRNDREMENWSVATREERTQYKSFASARRQLKRASELPSPAPRGHFLREFGQSDREMVDNGNDQASITQALAMLNGPIIGAISHRYSVLGRDMKGESFRERLDTIFLTMLSRKPTAEELKIFEAAWTANPDAGSIQGIVWTIMNMRQFLFVQ